MSAARIIARNITAFLTRNFQDVTRNLIDIHPSIATTDDRLQQPQVTQPHRTVACQFLKRTVFKTEITHFHHTPHTSNNNVTVTTAPTT